ncbi:fungal-specific transcription factor domain-containing protein, partial [Thelonectria olida]
VRKRAGHACLNCRKRKIRCDVSLHGPPCTNCRLDDEKCEVSKRKRRQWRMQVHGESLTDDGHVSRRQSPDTNLSPADEHMGKTSSPNRHGNEHEANGEVASERIKGLQTDTPTTAKAGPDEDPFKIDIPTAWHGEFLDRPWKGLPTLYYSSYVTYAYYPFLSLSNLPLLPTHDICFLEVQGCLHVPCRPLLTEFMRQYFLHLHPILPILNEGDFWDAYFQNPNSRIPNQKVSLLLFQSMLFACCNFISHETINSLGLSNMREARATFYRRAKLLFDLEAESSSVAISQAALLLASWGITSCRLIHKPYIPWLSIAIQYAKDAEADRYEAFGDDVEHQAMLKRLWWCCIIRDHMLSLNLRRDIQITRRHFDFGHSSTLGVPDMANETHRSKVHEPAVKIQLARILQLLVELCILLTEALESMFPVEDGFSRSETRLEDGASIQNCKIALERWHSEAKARFPQLRESFANHQEGQHDSVVLFTTVLKMYYYSSKIVLTHYKLLQLTAESADPVLDDLLVLNDNRLELQNAALGTTGCLEKLLQLRLARWLPISAINCTALPLLLNIIDVEILSQRPPENHARRLKLKRHCLYILTKAMETYRQHYEGVDWVSDTIQSIVGCVRIEHARTALRPGAGHPRRGTDINEFLKVLMSRPFLYLRIAFILDVSLRTGRVPKDQALPKLLRNVLT